MRLRTRSLSDCRQSPFSLCGEKRSEKDWVNNMDEKKSIRFRLTFQIALMCVAAAIASVIVDELNEEGFILWLWRNFRWGLYSRANMGHFLDNLQWFKPELNRLGMAALFALAALIALVRVIELAVRLARLEGNPRAGAARERAVVSPRGGQDRYLGQLDEYLKNGIIDRAEYRVLKERYSRQEIPEDYR